MKQTFVQCAEVVLEPGADSAAPGGAVTRLLCGSWDHPGPCRWPHHTAATWDDVRGQIRVVFLAPEGDEAHVRGLIDQALAGGECVGPDGRVGRWTVTKQGAGVLTVSEQDWGEEIAGSSGASIP